MVALYNFEFSMQTFARSVASRLVVIAIAAAALPACGLMQRKAVGMVASTLASSGDVFTRDDDPELLVNVYSLNTDGSIRTSSLWSRATLGGEHFGYCCATDVELNDVHILGVTLPVPARLRLLPCSISMRREERTRIIYHFVTETAVVTGVMIMDTRWS